jgi:hypothetical protein
MKFKIRALGALAGIFAFGVLANVASGADRAYTEGSVLNVSSIRTEPGMFDAYMTYLAGTYKQLMKPGDPDIYLVTTYKNMAALDGLADRTDAIQQKLIGDMAQRSAAMIARGKLRTLGGSQLIRQLILK